MANEILNATLSTKAILPFRPATAVKSGNVYFAILSPSSGKYTRYGVPVQASVVGGALPKWVEVNGTKVTLTQTAKENGQAQAVARNVPVGSVSVDGVDTPMLLSLTITDLGGDRFNVTGAVRRPGGGGGGASAVNAL